MKANKLMIGDWVKINDVDYPAPAQVGGITKKHGTFYAHFPQWDLNVVDEKLEPIPLTKEILEKNGFFENWKYGWNYGDNSNITIDRDMFIHIFELDVKLNCVHELQHALKLCGIKKEIEL